MPRKKIELICQFCKKTYETRNPEAQFCSNACRGANTRLQGLEAIEEKSKIERLRDSHKLEVGRLKEEIKELSKPNREESAQITKLRQQISSFQSDIREYEKRSLTSQTLMEIIHGTADHDFITDPDWLESPKSHEMHGIPCLFLSDIHFDEYVDPAQIGYMNTYNREIATNRINHTFQTGIDLLMNYSLKPKYDGIVIALGGDLLSGNIHEELEISNCEPILKSVIGLTELLKQGIQSYAEVFGKVFVPCVVGNHGRLFVKIRAKNRVFDNYEWLIYQTLAKEFKNDDRVTFFIPDSPDAQFNIYKTEFLLTHGDQFRGGNGISGIFTPLMLGMMKKQKKLAAVNQSFEIMMCGHFHQYIHTNSLIVNGSIKGYDEWVNTMNFSFERPQQALFINHPENGMVMRTPILCDSYQGGRINPKKKISMGE